MEVSGQRNAPATLLPGIAPPLFISMRLGRPQSRCRPFGEEKITSAVISTPHRPHWLHNLTQHSKSSDTIAFCDRDHTCVIYLGLLDRRHRLLGRNCIVSARHGHIVTFSPPACEIPFERQGTVMSYVASV